jgi:hypothetical protein
MYIVNISDIDRALYVYDTEQLEIVLNASLLKYVYSCYREVHHRIFFHFPFISREPKYQIAIGFFVSPK